MLLLIRRMADFVENSLSDSFVTKIKSLAKLRHTSLKLHREAKGMQVGEKETEEIKQLALQCAKCSGNSEESDIAHIEDLCPVDKKRISNLIEHLSDCTREKYKAEESVALLEFEKEALENRYKHFCKQSEDEKSELKSQLQNAVTEVNKLRLQTSQSLELLMGQIKAQEKQFSQLTITTKNLVQEKSQLEKVISEMKTKLSDAEAKVQRITENEKMERLVLMKELMQKLAVNTEDQACQTQDISDTARKTSLDSNTNLIPFQKVKNIQHTKSENDLEEHTSDGKLLQELFFNRPNMRDNEGLNITDFD